MTKQFICGIIFIGKVGNNASSEEGTGSCLSYERLYSAMLFPHSVAAIRYVFKGSFCSNFAERIFFMKRRLNTKTLVISALLIALQIVFTRILSIETGAIRISLGFFPVAVAGMLFGPLGGGIIGVIADILGMLLFSKGNIYFFPFTISEFLYGFGFGLMLYKKNITFFKITIFTLLQFVILNLVLNSFWLYLYSIFITGVPQGFFVIFSMRITTAILNLPMQIVGLYFICRHLKKPLEKFSFKKG